MEIKIAAIGRLRDPAIEALIDRYLGRCPWKVEILELQPRARQSEGELLAKAAATADRVVALDERGHDFSSAELAQKLGDWIDHGYRQTVFIIGGSDGLGDDQRAKADLLVAFGRVTWPHLFVRAMLAEQIYRASTILTNHPYHRQG